jgi:hypothetical protein
LKIKLSELKNIIFESLCESVYGADENIERLIADNEDLYDWLNTRPTSALEGTIRQFPDESPRVQLAHYILGIRRSKPKSSKYRRGTHSDGWPIKNTDEPLRTITRPIAIDKIRTK